MKENYEFSFTIATAILAGVGLLRRFETRIFALSDRVSRIEVLLEGYFMHDSKQED